MERPDYSLIDADNHYYETRDCFSRHLGADDVEKGIHVVAGDDGKERIRIGDKPFTFLRDWSFERMAKPGCLREMLRRQGGALSEGEVVEAVRPEYVERKARLELMDRQRLEACFLFPTLAVCVEHFMKDDPEQLYTNLRAFNLWLDEEWGFGSDGRIFAAPLLSLRDVDRAVEELDWALARGARLVSLRPGPAFGRSPADPHFDPFWARINEAGATVAFHIAESGYNEMMSVHYGEDANPSSHRQSALQWSCFYGDRPIMDTIASLIFGNLFGRFANVRVLSVENGSLFVPYLMKVMDKMGGMGRNGPWPGGRIREKPSGILRRHVFVSPYHEEDIPALVEEIGDTQVCFGSDFPHAEGLAEPADFVESLPGLAPDAVRRIMRENALALVGGA